MKKEYDSRGWNMDGGMLFSIILLAVILIAILLGSYVHFHKPHYKIYKTECHNETVLEYEVSVIINYNYKINITYNFYDLPILTYLKVEDDFRQKINKLYPNCHWHSDENLENIWHNETAVTYSLNFIQLRDCFSNKEVCNEVEVENMTYKNKTFGIWIEYYSNISSISFNINKHSIICMGHVCYEWITISKKDINKKWLDKNCECTNRSFPKGIMGEAAARDFRICNRANVKGCGEIPCSEYKCDDYKINKI